MKTKPKFPTKRDLYRLCRRIKPTISDEFLAFEDDEEPGIQLTVGHDPATNEWDYQTGDNSYSGGAYAYPNWAVVGIYRNSNCQDLAVEILDQLEELAYQ
jgi:hypothetical protein